MTALVDNAIKDALEVAKLEYSRVPSKHEYFSGYYIHSEEFGCPKLSEIDPSKWHDAVPFYTGVLRHALYADL